MVLIVILSLIVLVNSVFAVRLIRDMIKHKAEIMKCRCSCIIQREFWNFRFCNFHGVLSQIKMGRGQEIARYPEYSVYDPGSGDGFSLHKFHQD